MGFRDIRVSLAQFHLQPMDPEAELQARIDRVMSESLHLSGLDEEDMSISINEPTEEWTLVYDKFQIPRR